MKLKKYVTGKTGFSFVELMVVLALISVLSAIALPSLLGGLSEKRLKSAARNLYADLQKARLLAVKGNKNVTVSFNSSSGEYFYPNGNQTITVKLTDYGRIQYGKGSAAMLWSPFNAVAIGTDFVPDKLVFNPTGTALYDPHDGVSSLVSIPDEGAIVYLQNENNDVCYAVNVTSFGAVKIRRFSGSSWE